MTTLLERQVSKVYGSGPARVQAGTIPAPGDLLLQGRRGRATASSVPCHTEEGCPNGAPLTGGWVGYGVVGSAQDPPKMSGLPKVAGQSTLGAGGVAVGSSGNAARQALMAGHTAPLRTSFQTAAP